ncbi:MAG: hypothetical protein NC453_21675 [Muribaculum sp.]|nr:hypothetical protein [Muribaculum sp.]
MIYTPRYKDFDFGAFQKSLHDKAQLLLTEVTEENLKYFSEETKALAEAALEKYVNEVYDLYADGAHKIPDLDILERFTDYRSGYTAQMSNWMKEHSIQLQEQKITIPEEPKAPQKELKPMPVATVGTAIAVGLLIFTNPWVALAAELLTIALTLRQMKRVKIANQKFEVAKIEYERSLKKMRSDLVNGLINELEEWIKQGLMYSDSVLDSYNLNEK